MSSTNKTTNYELTQFLATDVPSWLVDYNGDMSKIDTQMKVNATAAAAAQSKADGADSKADTNAGNIEALDAELNTASTGVVARLTDTEGDVDSIQSLIGNGTPTTTDQTIIGAINELNTKEGALTDLTTTDKSSLVGAINDVNSKPDMIIISASYGATPSTDDNFRTYLIPMLSNLYGNIYNSTHGGDSFSSGTYLTQLQALAANINNKNNVKVILVNDTGNDGGANTETLYNSMVAFKNYCRETFPNAKILLAPCTTRRTPTTKKNAYNVYNYMASIQDGTFMSLLTDMFNILGRNYETYVGSDGVHPNTAGAKLMANAIYSCLTAGGFEFTEKGRESFKDGSHATGSGVTIGSTGAQVAYMDWYKNGKTCHINTQIDFELASDTNLGVYWDIATQSLKLVETKQLQGFNIMDGNRFFNGYLCGPSENIPVVGIVWYDETADKYFLHILGVSSGSSYRLTAATAYKLLLNDSIDYNFQ